MLKREYDGPPIDATEQYVSERNKKGETVGGTTEDDLFDESADWLPRDMDESDFTDKQKQALRAFLAHSDRESVTATELAKNNNFSRETAQRAIHKAFPDSRGLSDLSDSRELAIHILAYEGGGKSQNELADTYPIPKRAFGEAKRVYPDLIEEVKPISKDELDVKVREYESAYTASTQTKEKHTAPEPPQKPKEEKEYPEDFSDTYQWFVETVSDHPDKGQSEIKELIPDEAEFSPQNYYNVIRDYADVVLERIKEKGTANSESELNDYLADHIDSFGFETMKSDEPNTQPEEQESELEKRLRAVESKTETLRQEVTELKESNRSTNTDLASVIVESLSDDELGQLVREAIVNE